MFHIVFSHDFLASNSETSYFDLFYIVIKENWHFSEFAQSRCLFAIRTRTITSFLSLSTTPKYNVLPIRTTTRRGFFFLSFYFFTFSQIHKRYKNDILSFTWNENDNMCIVYWHENNTQILNAINRANIILNTPTLMFCVIR